MQNETHLADIIETWVLSKGFTNLKFTTLSPERHLPNKWLSCFSCDKIPSDPTKHDWGCVYILDKNVYIDGTSIEATDPLLFDKILKFLYCEHFITQI